MKLMAVKKRWLAAGGAGVLAVTGTGVIVGASNDSNTHNASFAQSGPGGSSANGSKSGTPPAKPSGSDNGSGGPSGSSGGAGGSGASGGSGGPTANAASASSGGGPGQSTETYSSTGSYTHSSGTTKIDEQTITAASTDESGVLVKGGTLSGDDITVKTSGNTKSQDESSFYGLNAGVLVNGSGKLTWDGGTIATTGTGANALFAYGNAQITAAGTTLKATGNGGHGAMAAGGGQLTLTDLTIDTAGQSAAAFATDRGGGTITSNGGTATTSGFKSPVIYSTGNINITNLTGVATGAEAAVVEGDNEITVTDSKLTATKQHGVMLYQSMSGDAQVGTGTYTMHGGSLLAKTGPAFYVTNERAVINLTGNAKITAASGVLLRSDSAGTGSGNTGAGITTLRASDETLNGNLIAAGTGTIAAFLTDSTLTGALTRAALTLNGSSVWKLTANSTVTRLRGLKFSGSTVTNIKGNGHTIYYVSAEDPALDGKTYKLSGGGTLKPA